MLHCPIAAYNVRFGKVIITIIIIINNNSDNNNTVNSLIATTSHKRPSSVSDHLVNNGFVSQLNTVSRAVS